MFLILRQDADGEVMIAATDEEKSLTEIIVRDIGKRFPPQENGDESDERYRRRMAFLNEAYLRHACDYKLLVVT